MWQDLGVEDWTGLDISTSVVEENRKRFPSARFHCLDLTGVHNDAWDAAGEPGTFDLVTAIDVLYHIVDDGAFAAAVANLTRFVAPGGLLVVSDIFVAQPQLTASHVRRRPVEAYLAAGVPLTVLDREPIFAILGDPIRRPGFHAKDEILFGVWRMLQKGLRLAHPKVRDGLGSWVTRALAPLDQALRPFVAGINLELLALRRT